MFRFNKQKIFFVTVISTLFLCGCAEFDLKQLSLSSTVTPLSITNPVNGEVIAGATTFLVSGTCDSGGSIVSLSGSTLQGGGPFTGSCQLNGTFAINVNVVGSGTFLDISASQTDSNSGLQSDLVTNLMIHCAGAPIHACASSGSGNLGDAYLISDISCLQEMRTGLNCHYELENDIDASVTVTWNAGAGWEPVPVDADAAIKFTGTLNGAGYTISNLTTSERNAFGTGLFSRIGDEGNTVADIQVQDLSLDNFSTVANNVVGALAGDIELASVNNITVSNFSFSNINNLDVDFVGGLAGSIQNSSVTNSNISGDMDLNLIVDSISVGFTSVGGVVGEASLGSIVQNVISNININSNPANSGFFNNLGGVIGASTDSQFLDISQNGDITLNTTHTATGQAILGVGGFMGADSVTGGSTITRVCQDSVVSFNSSNRVRRAAGFIGALQNGSTTIDQVSVRGSLTSTVNIADNSWVGGFTGQVVGDSDISNIALFNNVTFNGAGTSNAVSGSIGILSSSSAAQISNLGFFGSLTITNPTGGRHGAVVGWNEGAPVFNSVFYDTDSDGGFNGVGDGGSIGVSGLTNAVLTNQANASYAGWDFASVWSRPAIPSLPILTVCL